MVLPRKPGGERRDRGALRIESQVEHESEAASDPHEVLCASENVERARIGYWDERGSEMCFVIPTWATGVYEPD